MVVCAVTFKSYSTVSHILNCAPKATICKITRLSNEVRHTDMDELDRHDPKNLDEYLERLRPWQIF